jgi:protein phosphatase PTC7
MQAQQRLFGGTDHYSEQPSDADVYQHALAHGDVLLFATDGVWDNLSPEDTLRIISSLMLKSNGWVLNEQGIVGVGSRLSSLVTPTAAAVTDSKEEPKDELRIASPGLAATIATAITRDAKMASLDKKRSGPFEKEVKKHFPWENWSGGKPDDICSLVAVVIEDPV